MKTIHKYALSFPRGSNSKLQFTMFLPKDAQILHIAMKTEHEYPMMWAIIDTDNETEYRELVAIGTGAELSENKIYIYLGTVQQGTYIWHYFEIIEDL